MKNFQAPSDLLRIAKQTISQWEFAVDIDKLTVAYSTEADIS
jgi:hypothetical protein